MSPGLCHYCLLLQGSMQVAGVGGTVDDSGNNYTTEKILKGRLRLSAVR